MTIDEWMRERVSEPSGERHRRLHGRNAHSVYAGFCGDSAHVPVVDSRSVHGVAAVVSSWIRSSWISAACIGIVVLVVTACQTIPRDEQQAPTTEAVKAGHAHDTHEHVGDTHAILDHREGSDHRFDMSHSNVIHGALVPHIAPHFRQWISPRANDASVLFAFVEVILTAAFDAVVPYHPTAVGVYSRLEPRRPAGQGEANLLPNIAAMYASHRTLTYYLPQQTDLWRTQMAAHGLDLDYDAGMDQPCAGGTIEMTGADPARWATMVSEYGLGPEAVDDLATAAAIGNLAARCVLEGRRNDGFNFFGEQTDGLPMLDPTGYTPVNTPFALHDPSRWQPLVVRVPPGGGTYAVQHFVTPQWANTEPYAPFDPREFRVDPPVNSDHTNLSAYQAQADEVIDAVANLTDRQKMIAEFFDNKLRGAIFLPTDKNHHNVVDFVTFDFLTQTASFDTGIVVWQEKRRYDAVRPVTAIRYLYGDRIIEGYGGPGRGTVELPANRWRSYVTTADHPEYPSATTAFCASYAQVHRRFAMDYEGKPDLKAADEIGEYRGVRPAGASTYEPGITPAAPVTINFDTWTEYEDACADARFNTGVHFRAAVEASIDLGRRIGDVVYPWWKSHMDGSAPVRQPAKPLPPDPLLDEPHWTGR